MYKSDLRNAQWWHPIAVTACWVWPSDWPAAPTGKPNSKAYAKALSAHTDQIVVLSFAAAEVVWRVKQAKSIDLDLLMVCEPSLSVSFVGTHNPLIPSLITPPSIHLSCMCVVRGAVQEVHKLIARVPVGHSKNELAALEVHHLRTKPRLVSPPALSTADVKKALEPKERKLLEKVAGRIAMNNKNCAVVRYVLVCFCVSCHVLL
jgi:hypothetical protein